MRHARCWMCVCVRRITINNEPVRRPTRQLKVRRIWLSFMLSQGGNNVRRRKGCSCQVQLLLLISFIMPSRFFSETANFGRTMNKGRKLFRSKTSDFFLLHHELLNRVDILLVTRSKLMLTSFLIEIFHCLNIFYYRYGRSTTLTISFYKNLISNFTEHLRELMFNV